MTRAKHILFIFIAIALGGCDGPFGGCEPDARWGMLANPGFKRQRIKTTLFFSGQAKDGSDPYGCDPGSNLHFYTVHPENDLHLNWYYEPTSRTMVIGQMVNAGINVVTMSSWGDPRARCGGRRR